MNQQQTVSIQVSCVSGGDNGEASATTTSTTVTGRRRFRGHDWSHKKRRVKTKTKQNFLCYAVFKGEKQGVWYKWKDVEN